MLVSVQCTAVDNATWIEADGSPYNGMAYCEQFPRGATAIEPFSYWAQVGDATVPRANYDNLFQVCSCSQLVLLVELEYFI